VGLGDVLRRHDGLRGIGAADVWELLPDDLRRRFARVASGMRRVMSQLGEGADTAGLIHADMHLGNALFWRGEVKVIDFDDSGFGYWLMTSPFRCGNCGTGMTTGTSGRR
jgi:Ser/Thr protein kinase RdoA (MazF antagonist)